MDQGYLNLESLWFALIGVLWIGYFFLEGFDFGVGILLPFLGRDEVDRRIMVNDRPGVGRQRGLADRGRRRDVRRVPEWYATLFSGFYLALFLILAALIFRGVAFEFRGRTNIPSGSAGGTARSSGAAPCRRSYGASRSATSCECRSTRTRSSWARSSTCCTLRC